MKKQDFKKGNKPPQTCLLQVVIQNLFTVHLNETTFLLIFVTNSSVCYYNLLLLLLLLLSLQLEKAYSKRDNNFILWKLIIILEQSKGISEQAQ